MHPISDHERFRSLVEQGEITIGVDPAAARRLFTDSRMSSAREAIGEPIVFECSITFVTFYLAPICLTASFYFACLFFGWWSLVVIPVSAILWFFHQGKSSTGRPGILFLGLAFAFVIWLNLAAMAPLYRWLALIVASVFLTRVAYRVGAGFLGLLVVRNARAYDLLRESIYVKER